VPDDRSKKINFYERACILRYTSPSGSDETRRRRRSLEIKSEESAFTTKTAVFVAKMTLTAPRLSNTSNVQCVGVTVETTLVMSQDARSFSDPINSELLSSIEFRIEKFILGR